MDCACLTLKKQVRLIVGTFGGFPFEVGSRSEAQVLLNSAAMCLASLKQLQPYFSMYLSEKGKHLLKSV